MASARVCYGTYATGCIIYNIPELSCQGVFNEYAGSIPPQGHEMCDTR
jgi:hypothetical protein